MGLKPKDKTVGEIFKKIDYGIDFYQREYKWSDSDTSYKPIKALLDDIFYRFNMDYNDNLDPSNAKNLDTFEWYYLNSFMTNTVDNITYVVDGQQRLTTLTLIHIKLFHLAKEYELPSHLIKSIEKSIYDTNDFGTSFCMGVRDRKDAIENLYLNDLEEYKSEDYANVSEKNIYKNYKNISKILDSQLLLDEKEETIKKLHFFILFFRNKIYLIDIVIEKSQDVPMVFEVINDRGIPLKAYEILKGKLLGQINRNDISKYIDEWESMVTELEAYREENIDDFFSNYFQSKYSTTTIQYKKLDTKRYHKAIFTNDFDDTISLKHNEERVREFIEQELVYFGQIYVDTLDCYWDYDKDYEHIYFNRLNNIDGQFPLMLSAIELNDPDRDEKMKLISRMFDRNFSILNLTNSYQSNYFNESLMVLIKNIREKTLEEIKREFDKRLLYDIKRVKDIQIISEPFKYDYFKNIGYTSLGKKFLRYFFARIENYIADFTKQPTNTYHQLVLQSQGGKVHHIEHIITNNVENHKLFTNEEEFYEQRNRLGGLLLLKGKDNISSGDELYKDKLHTYNVNGTLYSQTLLKDNYKSNVDFKNFIKQENLNFKPYDDFEKEEIEERHQLLFELSKKIWDVDIDKDVIDEANKEIIKIEEEAEE